MAFFIWLLLLLSLSKFNSIPSFLFLNHLVSFKIQKFSFQYFCDIILCNDFSKFVVIEDSLQDKLETISMTANTVVNESVFSFLQNNRNAIFRIAVTVSLTMYPMFQE